MKERYAFDTCSFIEMDRIYSPKLKSFADLWENIEELFEDGTIISSQEVFDEIHNKDMIARLKKYKENFRPLSKEIQDKAKEILQKYPKLIKILSKKNSNADPFLIATAILESCTIVTEEKINEADRHNPNKYNIPKVCNELGINYITLNQFIKIIDSM